MVVSRRGASNRAPRAVYESVDSDRILVGDCVAAMSKLAAVTVAAPLACAILALPVIAEVRPDFVKIDRHLIRGMHSSDARRALVVASLRADFYGHAIGLSEVWSYMLAAARATQELDLSSEDPWRGSADGCPHPTHR